MDYKELIEQLRNDSNCGILNYIEDAATAIETLLAERDAAIKDMKRVAERSMQKHCYLCKHAAECAPNVRDKRRCYYGDGFEWRGPKKEDGGHG